METKEKRKNPFSAISINRITAERFRIYSNKTSFSHSQNLDDMMTFFEIAKISPRNKLMMHHLRLYSYLISRLDYIVELLREQEQKYHKPTLDILTSLFGGRALAYIQQPHLEEPKFKKRAPEEMEEKKTKISLEKFNVLQESHKRQKQEFLDMLNKVKRVEPAFGKAYYRIDTDATELTIIKRRLEI